MDELLATLERIRELMPVVKARRANRVPTYQYFIDRAFRLLGWPKIDLTRLSQWERKTLLHGVRLAAKAWLHREAERAAKTIEAATKGLLGKAKDAANRFFDRAGKALREMMFAGWLAMTGVQEPTEVEKRLLDGAVQVQRDYLEQFRVQVLSEERPLDPSRAEQYGANVWGDSQDVQRQAMIADGLELLEWAEHMGEDAPCSGCVARLNMGRVPLGTLTPIGETSCRVNCHCFINYVNIDGTPWTGRGAA